LPTQTFLQVAFKMLIFRQVMIITGFVFQVMQWSGGENIDLWSFIIDVYNHSLRTQLHRVIKKMLCTAPGDEVH
jgi:hypothetical protein